MLRFRNVSIFFLILTLGLCFIPGAGGFSLWWFIPLLLVYIGLLAYGSLHMSSGFYLPSLTRGGVKERQIALSFDDGPDKLHTPVILEILKQHDIKAAFFVIGNRIKGNEMLLKQMVDEGHVIGTHSYDHSLFYDFRPAGKMAGDIERANGLIEEVVGKKPRWFRPPYGVTTPPMAKALQRTGMVPVGWSVRSFDTVKKNPEALLIAMVKKIKPGAFFLFHDHGSQTARVLPALIREAQKNGFIFVSPEQLLKAEAYA